MENCIGWIPNRALVWSPLICNPRFVVNFNVLAPQEPIGNVTLLQCKSKLEKDIIKTSPSPRLCTTMGEKELNWLPWEHNLNSAISCYALIGNGSWGSNWWHRLLPNEIDPTLPGIPQTELRGSKNWNSSKQLSQVPNLIWTPSIIYNSLITIILLITQHLVWKPSGSIHDLPVVGELLS